MTPSRTLAPRARLVWRLEQAFVWGILVVVSLVFAGRLDGVLELLARVLPVLGLVIGVAVVPELRWRRWRWDVRPDAIDIRRGTFTVRRTLVPMLRVQHVDTTSDILQQQMDLADVVVHTAAGSHKIPLLTQEDAGDLRDRIAELARTADEP